MEIGKRVRLLRLQRGLTQEELAARTELSKGFISQLERDITSPSIATLMDILEALGTDVSRFFSKDTDNTVVYREADMFEKESDNGVSVKWLVTSAQKNALEPILVSIPAGIGTEPDEPHEGEEFGYVLSGNIELKLGMKTYKAHKGDSFCFRPTTEHYIRNSGAREAKVLWVSTPPSF